MKRFLVALLTFAVLAVNAVCEVTDTGSSGAPVPVDSATITAAGKRLVTRELALGNAELSQAEEMLRQTLSPQGSYKVLKFKRTVLLTDIPEAIEAVRPILKALSEMPAMNVRIEVAVNSIADATIQGGSISGRAVFDGDRGRAGVFVPPHPSSPYQRGTVNTLPSGPFHGGSGGAIRTNGGAVDIDLINQRSTTGSMSSQFLLVRSGGIATLEVVREVPVVDYFLLYGAQHGFVTPGVRWEKAGSQLLIKPVVTGDFITVEVTPRISRYVTGNRAPFDTRPANRPLTGADQFIEYTQLTTTVTVPNGGTITIGGFSNATPEFNRYFFGGTRSSTVLTGSITLRATVE